MQAADEKQLRQNFDLPVMKSLAVGHDAFYEGGEEPTWKRITDMFEELRCFTHYAAAELGAALLII